jgi:hypothetical protein
MVQILGTPTCGVDILRDRITRDIVNIGQKNYGTLLSETPCCGTPQPIGSTSNQDYFVFDSVHGEGVLSS